MLLSSEATQRNPRNMEREARTAIVTGAARRVGRAIAEALVADGWAVIAHVRRDEDDVPEGARKAVADLSAPDCAERIFAACEGLPPPSLLVNNAARFAFDSVADFDAGEFDAHMAVNVRAPALLGAAFAKQGGSGDRSIINILDAKISAPNPDFASYTISKQALEGYTMIAARAFASMGIRVNAVAPALMLRSKGQDDQNFESTHGHNPLGRGVRTEDLVAAVRYFASAKTVTGQILTLDSGQHFWSLPRDVQFLEQE